MLPTVAALLSLLRRPRPEQEAPAPPPRKRSGTYLVTRPRRADDLDAWIAEFVNDHPCRADESDHLAPADVERYIADADDEPVMMRDERGDRATIPDV